MISWVGQGCVLEKTETISKAGEVLVAPSMFDPEIFKIEDGVLMFTKAANKNQIGEAWRICFLDAEKKGFMRLNGTKRLKRSVNNRLS